MNTRTHRVLTSIALSLTGIAGLLAATDPSALGVAAHTWAWIAFGLSAGGLVVQGIRQAWESDTVVTVTK